MKTILDGLLHVLTHIAVEAALPIIAVLLYGATIGLEKLGLALSSATMLVVMLAGAALAIAAEGTRYIYKLDANGELVKLSPHESELRVNPKPFADQPSTRFFIHGLIATLFACTASYFVAHHRMSYGGSVGGGFATLFSQTFAFLGYDWWLSTQYLRWGSKHREERRLGEAIASFSEARLLYSGTRYAALTARGEIWLEKQEFEFARHDFIEACAGQVSLGESQRRLDEVQKAEFLANYVGDNSEAAYAAFLEARLSRLKELDLDLILS